MNVFELPAWLGHCTEEYVEHHLPVLQREASRRGGPGALAVPNERDGKRESLMFPGWDASTYEKQLKRVSGSTVTDVRALFEEEVKQRKVYFGVPDAVVENFCGHL